MKSMKIYICDHCKKSIDELGNIKVLYKKWPSSEIENFGEICDNCYAKLEAWLNNPRKAWMTKYNSRIKPGMEFDEIEENWIDET